MAKSDMDYLWSRLDDLATPYDEEVHGSPFKPKDEKGRKQLRRLRIAVATLDVISLALWIYAFLKLFVGDVDRWILERISPNLVWLVDFRFFVVLGVVALILVGMRKPSAAWPFAYVAFFPLIVVFWKVPRFFFRLKSGVAALGFLQVVSGVVAGVRRTTIGLAVLIGSSLAIFLGGGNWVTVGMVAIAALLIAWLWRAIRSALRPSGFVTGQQRIIGKLVGSKFFERATTPQQKVDKASVAIWTNAEAASYITTASFGLVIYRSAYYWAYSLDAYRRGAASVVFGAISVLTLFVQVAVCFGLLNYGLFRLDATQFNYSNPPTFWTFIYYAFAGCFFGEIAAVVPADSVAFAFKIANGILGGIIVLTLIAAIVLGIRHTRTDEVSAQAIRDLKARADAYGDSVGEVYAGGSAADLESRLQAFKFALSGLLAWLIKQSPPGWAPK